MDPLLAFFSLGPEEMLIVGVIAVLLFGERLPEVSRSLGKSLIEFKNGLRTIENEIDTTTSSPASPPSLDAIDREEAVAPKFVPPPTPPTEEPTEV